MIKLEDVERGYARWAAKPHNAKWVRRIDGTPIANDICVNIFEELKSPSPISADAVVEACAKVADAREWLIRKNGYFYRPNKSGYTLEKAAAGRYTKADADREAAIEPHNFTVMHESEVEDAPQVVDLSAEITALRKELAEARAENEKLANAMYWFSRYPEFVPDIKHSDEWQADIEAARPFVRPPSKAKGEKK